MKRVLILVEGLTEEAFINYALSPHLLCYEVFAEPVILRTKLSEGRDPHFKGGHTSWAKIRRFLLSLLGDSSVSLVTTMLDYYARPDDIPGNGTLPKGSCWARVKHLEEGCQRDLPNPRFLSYFSLHEFEALLFSAPEHIAKEFPLSDQEQELMAIRAQFNSPEEIDDSPATSPAKRLEKLYPYRKRLHGPLIAQEIGLELIRQQCPHFNDWLTRLEALGAAGGLRKETT